VLSSLNKKPKLTVSISKEQLLTIHKGISVLVIDPIAHYRDADEVAQERLIALQQIDALVELFNEDRSKWRNSLRALRENKNLSVIGVGGRPRASTFSGETENINKGKFELREASTPPAVSILIEQFIDFARVLAEPGGPANSKVNQSEVEKALAAVESLDLYASLKVVLSEDAQRLVGKVISALLTDRKDDLGPARAWLEEYKKELEPSTQSQKQLPSSSKPKVKKLFPHIKDGRRGQGGRRNTDGGGPSSHSKPRGGRPGNK